MIMKELRIDENRVSRCYGSLQYGNGTESSQSRRAFSHGDLLYFRLVLPRQLGATEARIVLREDETGNTTPLELTWQGIEGNCDVWEGEVVPGTLPVGLYFLRGEIRGICGPLMTRRTAGEACTFVPQTDGDYPYQLTVCDFAYPAPEWLWGGIIYQVFVDRFARGEETPLREGACLNPDWEGGMPQYPPYPGAPLANNMFFGGNLSGIEQKLDYIASLGVNCIYLTPIFEAYSNHKYDTGNYLKIDETFGGEEAFSRLLLEAKRRNIRIILDGVFNHTGDDSIYFNRRGTYDSLGAYESKESPYYSWYDFQEHPDKYTCWWDIPILPRIHTERAECREYFLGDGGVIDKYAAMGIGGFRLDVADELPDVFLEGVKERLVKADPENVLFGEVWEDASNKIAYGRRRRYFQGRQLDGVMNYELRRGIIELFRGGNPEALRYALCEVMPNAPARVQHTQMNLFGSHDTARILTALAGKLSEGHTNDELAVMRMSREERALGIKRLKAAYLLLATLPGVPMIYYGDEVGMEGYSDPFNRLPFPWTHMDAELLSHYRKVGHLRREHKAYTDGAFSLLALDADKVIFTREGQGETCLTVINLSDRPLSVSSPMPIHPLLGGAELQDAYTVPPLEGAVFSVAHSNGAHREIEIK